MMFTEKVQTALVSMKVTSDEEIIVDRMIAASQRKGETALPSFGRDLVPYFVPGTEAWNENDVNVNTDVDSFRRQGASLMDIPVPTFREWHKQRGVSTNGKRERKGRSRFRNSKKEDAVYADIPTLKPLKVRSDRKTASAIPPISESLTSASSSESDMSEKETRHELIEKDSGVKALSSSAPGSWGLSSSHYSEGVLIATSQKSLSAYAYITPPTSPEFKRLNGVNSALLRLNEKWAGPAYANSPPPSCVPLPTFASRSNNVTGSSAMTSKSMLGCSVAAAVQSAPASPSPASPAPAADSLPIPLMSVDSFLVKKRQSEITSALGLPCRVLNMDDDAPQLTSKLCSDQESEATNKLKKILQIF